MRFYNSYNSYPNAYAFNAVRILIAINIVVFILCNFLPCFPWFFIFGLVPSFLFTKWMLWQPVTYLFLHGGLWHLVINMLMLWMFGMPLEEMWGSRRFLAYYFFTGIGAGIFSVLFAYNSQIPVVGASGAIFGLLVAFSVISPESIILLFFIFPMKMKHAVVVLGGINLLGALSSGGSGIAYTAHLGGGLLGYLYLKNEQLRFWLARFNISGMRNFFKEQRLKKERRTAQELDIEIDRILDKISLQGIGSLTRQEKKTLRRKGSGS
ncbi:MAG: rhomboid family intramembrane serine protease [Candidatus Omnitrophica bacterium]|nr:rhomboid family intramembrane serine protease [Candidatus Omnitrophota bacterium]MBU4478861.1 rhomboid family intramembrane serine protease [Candidatus Omnitrophota bacterium]MCG2703125.1 rhomboid family intramembrane serine protease [Candidatus Omnitrophota bacterium]